MGRGQARKGFLKRDNDVAIMKMVNKKHIEDTEAQRKARVVKKTTKPDYVAPCLEEEPPPNKQLTFIESKFTQKVDYDKWVCEGAFGDQRSAETIADDMHASHEQVVSRKNMNARNEMDVLNETKRIFFAIVETQTLTDIFANFGFDDLLLLWDSAADAKTPKLVDSTKDLLSMDDDDFQTSVDSEDLHIYMGNKSTISQLLWIQQRALTMLDEAQFDHHFPNGPTPIAWIGSYTNIIIFGYAGMTVEESVLKLKGASTAPVKSDDILFVL
jgi:hypothetical protein